MSIRTISQTIDLMNKSVDKYITTINDGGISIHPEIQAGQSSIQLNGDGLTIKDSNDNILATYHENGVEIYNSNGISVAEYGIITRIGDENDFHILVDNNELGLYDGSTLVASLSEDKLIIEEAELETSLRVGKFLWMVRGTDRISLRYNPKEED